ncbi:hypothetical protein SCANM63S_04754 [Streptomyces canarius]
MESTRIAGQPEETRAPLTDAEREQAAYALLDLARSESAPDALRVPSEQLELIRPFLRRVGRWVCAPVTRAQP